MNEADRQFCTSSGCDALILQATAKATGGVCMPCFKSSERRRQAIQEEEETIKREDLNDLELTPLLESFFLQHMLFCFADCCQESAFSKEISQIEHWGNENGIAELRSVQHDLSDLINESSQLPIQVTHIRIRVFEQQWQRDRFSDYFGDWKDRVEFVIWKLT